MKRTLLIITLLFSICFYGQSEKVQLVSFKNNTINKVMSKIFDTKNNCISTKKTYNWYIEQKTPNSFIVSISRVGNLLQSLDDKKLYITLIEGVVVFIKADANSNLIEKTNFNVDVSKFTDNEFVLFEDFSAWLVKMDEKSNQFNIVNKKLFKCK